MKQEDVKNLELSDIEINYQINYSLNKNKDSLIQHSSNGVITELRSFKDYQTIIKIKPIIQNNKMNYYIHFDIMSEISNYINNKDINLRMCTISFEQQQQFQQNQMQFQLIYAITFEYGFQIKENPIDQAIIQISSRIDKICIETYNNGDINLIQQIDELFEQFQEFLN
ncbi:unnamed protein product [Paramecium primaurelia]|uniref:Uncharacterized protein n=1 Tax=Paramecium primaurelia TaxID=5886 RepID=A0A8S1K4L2_PARPR|nr:unnamed protein product [Paramecium primaurelia]